MWLRRVSFLVLLSAFSLAARAGETRGWVYGSGVGVLTQEILKEPVRFRPGFRLGADWKFESLLWGSILGLEFSGYKQPIGPVDMRRSVAFLRLGRRFLEERLVVAGLFGRASTEIEGYDSGSGGAYGLNGSYRFPVWRSLDVNFMLGWFWAGQHSVKREVGKTPNGSFTRAMCEIFTFGITDCPYTTEYEYITIPQSHQGVAGVGLGYSF